MREQIGVPVISLLLIAAIALGVDMIIHPRRHMNAYLRSGGEMLRDLNETAIQVFGVLVITGAAWGLYAFIRDVWGRCFA